MHGSPQPNPPVRERDENDLLHKYRDALVDAKPAKYLLDFEDEAAKEAVCVDVPSLSLFSHGLDPMLEHGGFGTKVFGVQGQPLVRVPSSTYPHAPYVEGGVGNTTHVGFRTGDYKRMQRMGHWR